MPPVSDIESAIAILNDVLARKLNSPASYVLEASPYVTDADRPILEAITALDEIAQGHAKEAAQIILALEGAPRGGSYDPTVADSNYLSVRYLLGQLLARLEQEIRLFDQYRARCELLEAKDFLTKVVEDDTAQRDRLKALKERLAAEEPSVDTHRPYE